MDFFDSRYFRINKLLLSLIGLWQCQTPNIKFLVLSFNVFGAMTILLPQVLYFLQHTDDLDEIFEVMPVTCGNFINLMKVICLTYNFKKEDWNNLPKSQEVQIILHYAEIGRKFTLTYLYCLIIFATGYALMPLVAPVLDTISPLNETRPRKLLFPAEYLMNQEKYYYVILLSEYGGYVICALIATATDTTYFLLLEHICGMQAVLCYRLKNLKASYKFGWLDNNQSHGSDGIDCRVRCCIQLDKRIRVYLEIIMSAFATFLLIDIVIGIVLHTCTCIMIVIRAGRLFEIMRFVGIAILQSIRLFFISWTGQQVTDHSFSISIAAYDAMWYLMPREVQKMLMLLIARDQNPVQIILAGIYVVSLESFSWVITLNATGVLVMKTSVSYCMVMISLRESTNNT